MTTSTPSPQPATDLPVVVVGISDSDDSDRAIRWGAEHARRIGGQLRLVHAFVWPLLNVDVDPVPGVAGSGLRAGAETLVAHAEAVAREVAPEIPVLTEIVEGRSADVLVTESRGAAVLAVGSRGLGRMMAVVMGSTSLALARYAACPVVVVRGDEATDGPIGVAYESSDLGEQALERAGRLAAAYEAEVHVVIGVHTPAAEHDRILAHTRQAVARAGVDVPVKLSDLATAHSAKDLVAASEGSRMLVVPAASEGLASASSRTGAVVQLAHTPIWIERPLQHRG
ncbi:universal stress protein [Brachybacterium sp. EF45031]|uniref:universal stress protein n=1 Tax=Brachybacterium sillae TaxID=2810536 RepID=UPI00217E10B9|nr:universal stress protein [Brachybacterium sillae]MCS6710855.1 universal stress protein [Brachybacterium sillae]